MGDSRAEIDISFDIYGEHFEWDTSINYHPDEYAGDIDPRVAEWFSNCYAKARYGFDTRVLKEEAERRERDEREQLAKLKAKYADAD